MGGTAIADPRSNDALTVNPGAIGLVRRYDLAGHFAVWGDGWEGSASVLDSRESPLALGLVYRRRNFEPPLDGDDLPGWIIPGELPSNRKRYHDFAIGAALPFLEERASFGVGGSLSLIDHDRQDPGIIGNADVGFAFRPVDAITFGVAVENLLPVDAKELPLSASAGVRFHDDEIGSFAFEVDERLQGGLATTFRTGFEKPLGDAFALRGGALRDGAAGQWSATWGFGLLSVEGSLDYAMVVPLGEPLRFGSLVNQLGLRIRT